MVHRIIDKITDNMSKVYDDKRAQRESVEFVNIANRNGNFDDFSNIRTFSKLFAEKDTDLWSNYIDSTLDSLDDDTLIDIAHSFGKTDDDIIGDVEYMQKNYNMDDHEIYVYLVSQIVKSYYFVNRASPLDEIWQDYIELCYRYVLEQI